MFNRLFMRFLILYLSILLFSFFQDVQAQNQLEAEPESTSVSVDSLYREALEKSPVLRQQQLEIDVQHQRIVRERMGWLSSLRLGIQFLSVQNDAQAGVATVGVLPTLGLNLQIDFERLFTTKSKIKAATLEKAKAAEQLRFLQSELYREISELYFDYKLLVEKAELRKSTLQTIEHQMRLTEDRFQKGETDLDSYLKMINTVQQAQESYIEVAIQADKLWESIELYSTSLQ